MKTFFLALVAFMVVVSPAQAQEYAGPHSEAGLVPQELVSLESFLVDLEGRDLEVYGLFRGDTWVNQATGELVIQNQAVYENPACNGVIDLTYHFVGLGSSQPVAFPIHFSYVGVDTGEQLVSGSTFDQQYPLTGVCWAVFTLENTPLPLPQ